MVDIRPANPRDASDMTILIDMAGHGLPLHFWQPLVDSGEYCSVLEAGRERARRGEGSFSFNTTTMAEVDGQVAGMLIGYREPDEPEAVALEELPELVRPLVELEAEAAGTWYVNVLAVFPEFRSRGVGGALLEEAEKRARHESARGSSLIVEDTNTRARELYERSGYAETARRPFVPFPNSTSAKEWVLMIKQF